MSAAFFTAQAVLFAAILLTLLRVQANRDRAHARREDLLLNQLLHAVGRPWQPAPAEDRTDPEPEIDPDAGRYTLSPEEL